jgi:predicted PurR-regulated permease PerM
MNARTRSCLQKVAGPPRRNFEGAKVFSVTRRKSTTIFLTVLLGVSLLLAALILRSFWRPIVLAAIIGIGMYPLHERIVRRLRRPNLAATISTLIVLLIFLIPAFFLATMASNEFSRTAQYLNGKGGPNGVFSTVIHTANAAFAWLGRYVDLQKTGLQGVVDAFPAQFRRWMFTFATSFVKQLASLVVEGVITLFIVFFVFRDGPAIRKYASLLPLEPERRDFLFDRIRDSVFANLYGMLAVALAQGFLSGVAFAMLAIPSPVLLGILAGVCSLIPLIGPALVWFPACIFLVATGHWIKAIVLLAWGALVVGTSDNIIRPLVIMGRVKLHPLLLLFGLIGGAKEFGFIGLFIGPAIMSLIFALTDTLRAEFGWSRPATETLPENILK